MAIEYSSIETIESYDSVFIKFNKKSEEYNSLDNHSKLIILVAGLGLTNSIHERFIKSIIYEYTNNLINILEIQSDVRNNYLHGDFNFDDDIMFEVFKDNILDFQKIHSFTLKITRYSFVKNLSNLPDISSMI